MPWKRSPTKPTIESLRVRDALEIRDFKPATRRKSLAEQAEKYGRLDYLDGRKRELANKGKWPGIVKLIAEQHQLSIQYRSGFPDRWEQIAIDWIPRVVHRRRYFQPWFRCPRCNARRRYLIYFYGCYLCRRCGYGSKPFYAGDRLTAKKKKKRALRLIYNRCGGKDTDHPGVIVRPRHMKLFYFHRLRREAQARERELYYDEDRMRWKYPATRWFASPEKRSQ